MHSGNTYWNKEWITNDHLPQNYEETGLVSYSEGFSCSFWKDYGRPFYCVHFQNYRLERRTCSALQLLTKREGSKLTFPHSITSILAYTPERKWFSFRNHTTRCIYFAWPPHLSPSLLECVLVKSGDWVQHNTQLRKNFSSHFQKLRGREWETKGLTVKTPETQGCVFVAQRNRPSQSSSGPEPKDLRGWILHVNHGKALPFLEALGYKMTVLLLRVLELQRKSIPCIHFKWICKQ